MSGWIQAAMQQNTTNFAAFSHFLHFNKIQVTVKHFLTLVLLLLWLKDKCQPRTYCIKLENTLSYGASSLIISSGLGLARYNEKNEPPFRWLIVAEYLAHLSRYHCKVLEAIKSTRLYSFRCLKMQTS